MFEGEIQSTIDAFNQDLNEIKGVPSQGSNL